MNFDLLTDGWVSLPDVPGPPGYTLSVRPVLDGTGAARLGGLRVEPVSDDAAPLTVADVHALNLREAVRLAAAATPGATLAEWLRRLRRLRPLPQRRDGGQDHEFAAAVAEVWTAARARGQSGTRAVRDAWPNPDTGQPVSDDTARRWLREARRLGELPAYRATKTTPTLRRPR